MRRNIKTLLFGSDGECRAVYEILQAQATRSGYIVTQCQVDDLEVFEKQLVDFDPSLLIVVADGAEGMECVYRSRERRPCVPVFWFSDDPEFGLQSYRFNCAYFSTKPVTTEKLNHAIQRCDHIGIQYAV